MVKSPVEGSTVALVRLQTPVVYSDFVRPVCLPDDDFTRNSIITDYPTNSALLSSANLIDRPRAEKFYGQSRKKTFTEDRQFFQLNNEKQIDNEEENNEIYHEIMSLELVDEHMNSLKPEAQLQPRSIAYQTEGNDKSVKSWKNCNTLGWSRQKEHLQRVQLNVIDMKACENISIATVNSLCAEASYHKQDCNVSNFKQFSLNLNQLKLKLKFKNRRKNLREVRYFACYQTKSAGLLLVFQAGGLHVPMQGRKDLECTIKLNPMFRGFVKSSIHSFHEKRNLKKFSLDVEMMIFVIGTVVVADIL